MKNLEKEGLILFYILVAILLFARLMTTAIKDFRL